MYNNKRKTIVTESDQRQPLYYKLLAPGRHITKWWGTVTHGCYNHQRFLHCMVYTLKVNMDNPLWLWIMYNTIDLFNTFYFHLSSLLNEQWYANTVTNHYLFSNKVINVSSKITQTQRVLHVVNRSKLQIFELQVYLE